TIAAVLRYRLSNTERASVDLRSNREEVDMFAKIGIIGSGAVGHAVATRAVAAGIPVVLSNSRGPDTLTEVVDELGRVLGGHRGPGGRRRFGGHRHPVRQNSRVG